MNQVDQIFSEKLNFISNFKFDEKVAKVFDDMVQRSVPFYDEIHKIICDLVPRYLQNDDETFLDLGCSTGTTITLVHQFLKSRRNSPKINFVGVDNSDSMLKICEEKFIEHQLLNAQLHQISLPELPSIKSKMVVMNYTLQFIPPEKREKLLGDIYNIVEPGGVFILAEKIRTNDLEIEELTTDLYYDFKRRNGYSELEISQKREALEEVMIPTPPEEQIVLLKNAGFKSAEMVFRWYNFACYLCLK
ncbi:MAG: carboxy-S-adenosyl-L-methionine synthase CmoA [Bacteriovoracaceae bacterium]